jgi:hypothetical protein
MGERPMATAKQSKTSPKASNASKLTGRERPATKHRPPKTVSRPTPSQAKAASLVATSATKGSAFNSLFRAGSKGAKVVELLRRKEGATIAEMTGATGWQAHSVRGFLAGALKKKLGLEVSSTKDADGERRYRIAS